MFSRHQIELHAVGVAIILPIRTPRCNFPLGEMCCDIPHFNGPRGGTLGTPGRPRGQPNSRFRWMLLDARWLQCLPGFWESAYRSVGALRGMLYQWMAHVRPSTRGSLAREEVILFSMFLWINWEQYWCNMGQAAFPLFITNTTSNSSRNCSTHKNGAP